MLILSQTDLKYLLKPDELSKVFLQVKDTDSEVLLFVCSLDSIFLGYLSVDSTGALSFEDFVPSSAYRNLYCDLPNQWIAPCPLCSYPPSVIRLKNHGGKICVYSS